MELAADAIRGHKSAHSLATGPVMADPAQYLKSQPATHNIKLCQPPMHITLVAVQTSKPQSKHTNFDFPSPGNVCVPRHICSDTVSEVLLHDGTPEAASAG